MEGIKLVFGVFIFVFLVPFFICLEVLVLLFGGWTIEPHRRPHPVFWLFDACGLGD